MPNKLLAIGIPSTSLAARSYRLLTLHPTTTMCLSTKDRIFRLPSTNCATPSHTVAEMRNELYGLMMSCRTWLNVTLRSPESLFGKDDDQEPKVSLTRTTAALPPGATNDTVLAKCYRNQREVLVVAHALGFGIYRQTVQLLESPEHWTDVGYEVVDGAFSAGHRVRILRPEENSPLQLRPSDNTPVIECHVADNVWRRSRVDLRRRAQVLARRPSTRGHYGRVP